MGYDGPILDNHFHLNRKGRFLDAARDFQRVGGTHLTLVHCPDFRSPPTTRSGHAASYADTIAMAKQVVATLQLQVRVVLGPHPAAFAHQFEEWVNEDGEQGKECAIENYWNSIETALEFVSEGEAHALGEVGRPHWKVQDEIWNLSNELLEQTIHLAGQQNIPLQLHVEGESDETYSDLAQMAQRQGYDVKKLIRHYAPPIVDAASTHGLTPSVLSGKGAIETLLETIPQCSHGFFLETDYMDDLRRPGAVLGPKTVPKRTHQLLSAGVDESILWQTHHDLPNLIYGDEFIRV